MHQKPTHIRPAAIKLYSCEEQVVEGFGVRASPFYFLNGTKIPMFIPNWGVG